MVQSQAKQLKVTLVRGLAGKIPAHIQCVRGLGLRHRQHSVVVPNTPCIRGMIDKIAYMVNIEELSS